MKFYLALLLILSGFLVSCELRGGAELNGEGITFLVPRETSSSSSGDGGIDYDGKSVKASTDGKTLTVNGLNYGAVSVGDTIDLRTRGKVLVNDSEREPVAEAVVAEPAPH